MKPRMILLTLTGLTLTLLLTSCAGGERSSAINRYYEEITVYGKVIRSLPFRRQLFADVGSRDGIRKGDLMMLMRDGKIINHVMVDDVQDGTCYCSTMDPDPNAPQARVGDSVVRDPRLYEVREGPVEKTPEKAQTKTSDESKVPEKPME